MKTMLYAAAESSERENLCTEINFHKEGIALLLKYDTPDAVAAAAVKLRNLLKECRSSETSPCRQLLVEGVTGLEGGEAGGGGAKGFDVNAADHRGAVGEMDNGEGHYADGAYSVGDDDNVDNM